MSGSPRRDLVVVGGSAGGVAALTRFVERLPADLPAAVCVVLHMSSESRSLLPHILARHASIQVEPAKSGAPLRPGVVFVGVPDAHLVVRDGALLLGHGARENGSRPSIDALLRSAAVSQGSRVIGVVLTGMLDDGSAGLRAVLAYGGIGLVQDPADAEFPAMPRNALAAAPGCRPLALDDLVDEVVRIVNDGQQAAEDPADPDAPTPAQRASDEAEVRSALGEPLLLSDGRPVGQPSPYGCPDCGGVLNTVESAGVLRFRCRVGHAYTADSLLALQGDRIEDALWTALRALEERSDVSNRLSQDADGTGRDLTAEHFRSRSEHARHAATVLRGLLEEHRDAGGEPTSAMDVS